MLKNFGEGDFRHAKFVIRNRQAAFADVKNSGGRATVAFRIVQNTLFDAVGIDDVRRKIITIHRQREHAGEASAVERERARGQLGRGNFLKIVMQKILNAGVGGTEMLAEQTIFFARLRGHCGGDFDEFLVAFERHRRAADQGEFDIDVGDKMRGQLAVHGNCVSLFWSDQLNPLRITMPFLERSVKQFFKIGRAKSRIERNGRLCSISEFRWWMEGDQVGRITYCWP